MKALDFGDLWSEYKCKMIKKPPFGSEDEFIGWVQHQTARRVQGVRLGIGDDAALVKVTSGQELILKTDMSIEDVHFSPRLHRSQVIGHRALARSLSDIAAMGGTPRYALISLALSTRIDRAWLKGFYRGFFALARRFGVAVIGGDTAIVPGQTMVDVIVVGVIREGMAVLRSGARRGDQIFVSGRLGLSALGLRLLQSPAFRPKPGNAVAIRAHLHPQPQCALGRYLSVKGLATAMMDLSDGLSIDLKRLCDASGVGACLLADRIPSPGLRDAADSLQLALHGGEDYQLLFTVPRKKMARIPARFGQVPLHCIGEIQAAPGIRLVTPDGKARPLTSQGYDHFAREGSGE
jgi:thiamine-monophosphate kinase